MKIFVLGPCKPDSMEKNIIYTLKQMGHEVKGSSNIFFGSYKKKLTHYLSHFKPNIEDYLLKKMLPTVEEFSPDLIITTQKDLTPKFVDELKKRGKTKIVIWFPDTLINFGRQYMFAAKYDAYFFKDEYIVNFFKEKLQKNVFFLPEACNPSWHKSVSLTEEERQKYECDITVASSMYYYRSIIFENFQKYNLKIWGTNFPKWLHSPLKQNYQFQYVAEKEKAKAFRAAKIVLNAMLFSEICGVNARAFEAAGCGAFQIIDWKPNIELFFKPGEEIVTFSNIEELKKQVSYYLDHPEERQEIALKGQARAHADHTYEKRLNLMLEAIFNSGQGYPMQGFDF